MDDAISQFLIASAAVCQAAWAILHSADEQACKLDLLANASTNLWHTIQSLLDASVVNKGETNTTLVRACRKVAGDLEIRLDRAEEDVSDVWTQDVVEALATRLIALIRQWHTVNTLSDALLEDERALSRLRFSHQTDRNEEREHESISSTISSLPDSVSMPAATKSTQARYAPVELLNDFILDTLAFKGMSDRKESVAKAHEKTFDWIFGSDDSHDLKKDDFRHAFSAWLETDDYGPIYWMTGKPGSGKSTLMKYIYEHPRTDNLLRKWAGTQSVTTAGFFSWASGSKEQRSESGLLRSLLYQLLSVNPHLMPHTFPSLWDKIRSINSKERIALHLEWDLDQLLDAFQLYVDAAATATHSEMKTCLFIDGLDEFEEEHQAALVGFFQNLSLDKNVKMFLSSRPWNVFVEAFQNTGPSIRLQEITEHDLYRYVADRLEESDVFRQVLKHDTQGTEGLCKMIVDRADGVFLWIKLALNDILKGFNLEDGVSGLRERLDQLPSELDGLYEKFLFQDQTGAQLAETASFLSLIEAREMVADFINNASASSLTVWELAFALDEDDDDYAADGEVSEVSDRFIQDRCNDTVERLLQRFAGLLALQGKPSQGRLRTQRFADNSSSDEVNGACIRQLADNKITFIHRTVRDWLRIAHVHRRLSQKVPSDFDPHLRLLRSYILRLKRPTEQIEHHRRFDEWWPDMTIALTHARHITIDTKKLQRPFLNQLNKTLSWLWDSKSDPYDHWAASAFGFFQVRKKAPPMWHPFLCLATRFGLTSYVSAELDACITLQDLQDSDGGLSNEMPDINEQATPLLTYATEFLCSRKRTIYPLSDPDMIRMLLTRLHTRINPGPNHEYTDFETRAPMTAWVSVLRHLRDARRRRMIEYFDTDPDGIARWAEIVRLFLEEGGGGADVDAVVAADRWDAEITTVGVVELLAERYGAVELEDIRRLIQKRRTQSTYLSAVLQSNVMV